jgi:hypothetical protein
VRCHLYLSLTLPYNREFQNTYFLACDAVLTDVNTTIFPPNFGLSFIGLRCFAYQKIVFRTVTATRTSNPAEGNFLRLMSLKYCFAALPVTEHILYLLNHEAAEENCSDSLTIFSTCTPFASTQKVFLGSSKKKTVWWQLSLIEGNLAVQSATVSSQYPPASHLTALTTN